MKKFMNLAVAVIMMTLCAVMFVGCGENYTDDNKIDPTPVPEKKTVRLLKCIVPRIDYNTTGVVKTRGIEGVPEGTIDILSYHKATWLYGTDTISHTYTGRFVQKFYDVKRTRYAYNIDIFKNPVMTPKKMAGDSILWTVTFKDTDTHDFDISILELPAYYEKDYYQVGDSLMKLCKNAWVTRELIDAKINSITSPDDKYIAYSVDLYFQFGVEEGPDNKKTCMVTLPLVLVPKGGTDQPLPDEKHDLISFEEVDKGYDLVNDSVNNRWIDLEKVFSDGSREPFPRVAFVSKNHLFAPEYQIKEVDDFDWKSSPLKAFDATPSGDWQKRENNIYVMPMTQSCATYTDKGTCIFNGDFDGQAYFVDSLNQKHYFLYKEYTFEDDGWQRSDMQPTENFERKLLSSDIRGLFNGAELPRKGEIELRKIKGGDVKIIGYEYKNFDIRPITPNSLYWTYAEQYAVFSNNKTEKVGEIGTNLYIKTDSPEKQVIDVTDWNINDEIIQKYDGIRQTSRKDTISTGVFTITPFAKKNTTRTNKSKHNFTTTYDGGVVFVDKFGNEVKFKALDPTFEDKGGVRTLKDLMEEDDYERKSMTSTLAVTAYGEDVSTYDAEVIFRKAVEKEELLSWDKEQSLDPAGNGMWTSTTTIIYNWKLAGRKTDPISVTLDWSIAGEPKSHVILDKAEAPYKTFNESSWGNATKSYPYDGVTVVTSTKSYAEDYTTLTDKYTAKMSTASYSKVVDGKEIAFDFLAPSSMVISHASDKLVDGKRTTTEGATTYDVYDHTGSVTATVTGNGKSQDQSATDEKEIWVEKVIIPEHPEWGKPVKILGQGTFVYRPAVGPSGQGVFHENFNVLYEKGVLCLVTTSYVSKNYTNPMDFTYTESDFYPFGSQLRGATLKEDNVGGLNSAIWRDGKFEPAGCSETGDAWTYISPDGYDVGMTQQLAETCGLKNFTGQHTAYLKPWLNFSSSLSNGVLTIKNEKGVGFMTLR